MNEYIMALPRLASGLLVTAEVGVLVILISTLAGGFAGIGLAYGVAPLRWLIRAYVDIVRGIPVLILIFTVYYGLPALGLEIGSFQAAVAALSAFFIAHMTEIVRGSIQSIHHGQTEAGKAIGLSFGQRMVYVVLPQALRRFLPPWMNTVTDIIKGTALVSLVGVVDLILVIQQIVGRTFDPMPFYLLGAAIYIVINYTISFFSRRLEARYAYVRE